MKRVTAFIIVLAMVMGIVPIVSLGADYTISALKAFSWNYTANIQNGTLPTAVSWGDYRACFMGFVLPTEVIDLANKEDCKLSGVLDADMTFNNGRREGQAPVVTIIAFDGETILNADMNGGAATSDALKAAWSSGHAIGEFNTLTEDRSPVLDFTEVVKSGAKSIGLYITCRSEEGYGSDGIVNFNEPKISLTAEVMNEEYILSRISVPRIVWEGYELTDKVLGIDINWKGDNVENGIIKAGEERETCSLTAEAMFKGERIEKSFLVTVAGKEDKILTAYTTDDSNTQKGKSLHFALEGEELNFGMGVLYAEADMTKGNAGETKVLDNPWVFRMDNGFGVVGEVLNTDLTGNTLGFWTSENLYEFEYKGLLPFEGRNPCIDDGNGKYTVTYEYENKVYARETTDFAIFTDPCETTREKAEKCNIIVTFKEAERLYNKLGEIRNTGVEKVECIIEAGTKIRMSDMPMMTANYSDGGTDTIPVKWNEEDFNKIDFNKVGIYTVRGTADLYEPPFPMIDARPDPDIAYYNGKYYFIATNENGQNKIGIKCADSIADLKNAEEIQLFSGSTLWAPELHVIGGELYVLLAKGGGWNYVECHISKCTGDPTDPEAWESPVRFMKNDGSYLFEDGITLDMTTFNAGGVQYVMWAQRYIDYTGDGKHGSSDLWIGTIDPNDPYRLTSEPYLISRPIYGWDRYSTTVDEGPFAIKRDGMVYITYSGNGVDNSYVLGMLAAHEDADLLDVNNWKRSNYPVLASEHVAGEMGPGHNSFVKNEYGKDILVYHAKPNGATRSAGVRNVYWSLDGTPVLYMTPERYLKSEFRSVTANVIVKSSSMERDEFYLEAAANELDIPNKDNIKGNITLITEGKYGVGIEWKSSDEKIVSAKETENENYDPTPAGVVTRGKKDQKVRLTATLSYEGKTKTKEFDITVKAKKEIGEKTGYIYAYFCGSVNGEKEVQQIHIAISDDGLNWNDLNGNFPVIESKMGTKGLRDPYIIRSNEGDKFYLMATDLDANGGAWSQYGENGSKYLMFWESEDLVNWSEQRMIKVGDDNMGCAWAPEAIYDEVTGEYVIYWSSHRKDLFNKKVVQYAKTRDFVTFTEPKVFVMDETGTTGYIDTTMIKGGDGKYYRITKHENSISTFMESADKVLGEYETVDSNLSSFTGVEGPAIFKFNDEDKYCVMLDGYTGDNSGVGFFPVVTDDLAKGQFTRVTENFKMPTGAKHGVVLGITEEEYAAVMKKWGPLPVSFKGAEPEYSYTFENDGTDSEGILNGNARIENGILTMDGTAGSYFSLPKGMFNRRDTFTISMDVLSDTTANFFFTFGIGNDTSDYLFFRNRNNSIRNVLTVSGNNYEEGVDVNCENLNGGWHNYVMKVEPARISVYLDGRLVGEDKVTKTVYHLGEDREVTLGRSTFSGDAYFKGSFDNVKIYMRALSEEEISAFVSDEDKIKADAENITIVRPGEITADLILPCKGERYGSEITWESSDESVITNSGKVTRGENDKNVTVTATLTLNNITLKREFDLKVIRHEEDFAYLFAYFTGNRSDQERLFYGVSGDGYNFRALNGGESVMTSSLGTGCIRDPFIFKGEDGYYYIVATDMKSSSGWASNYATVVYKTPDLINIVDKALINYRDFEGFETCNRAWAPQVIWCPEKNAYMVYITIQNPADPYATVMYRHYATDLCDQSTYTVPELMLDEPAGGNGAIDGDIVYDKFHDEYIMYYCGKRIATCDKISGTWKYASTKYDDGQLPMYTSSGAGMAVEGSNIWKIIGEDKWVIAADGTSFNGGCYALVETADFENYKQLWENKGEYSFDFTPRHGYVIPISKRELNNLFEQYGEVDLPKQKPQKQNYRLNVDFSKKGVDIARDMFGIFYEDINYGADGGLYAEAVENRSFEAAHCNPDRRESYTKIPGNAWEVVNGEVRYLSEKPLNKNNTTYARFTAQKGGSLINECYGGFAVKDGEKFDVSLYARGDYNGEITVSITDGEAVLGSCALKGITGEFTKLTGIITAKGNASGAKVKVCVESGGEVDLDMISVMTQNTFNGRKNGLRRDLVQKLCDMHPGFIRFPGGCVVEGYYLDNRYNWKESVGPVEYRKENWNRWQTGNNAYDYCQTMGLGFYEYFLLCEDIGAKALPVVSVGIACQYQSGEVSSWEDLYNIYIKDAIDLIEFANGDPDADWETMTADITDTSKFNDNWANLRALMGHPESFNLEYLGIGNEQWATNENRFFERYEAFEEEIHKIYPDIKLISTSGPSADGADFDNAWNWLKTHNGEDGFTYAVDEHYYRTPEWFLANINRYDSYDRNGFDVFAGEYAANGAYGNTLWAALTEAAYLTGLERNADVVKLASYAPLLAKTGANQWEPDMIWFNSDSVYGSPDYYVQSMYANNVGDYTVENTVESDSTNYKAGMGTWLTSAQFKDVKITNNETGEVTYPAFATGSMEVKASHEPEPANPAVNLVDGNTGTRWATDMVGAYAEIDLGREVYVSKIAINFLAKSGRKYYYKIETSVDGVNYAEVFNGESRVNSAAAHYTRVDKEARYIRLTSGGNSEEGNNWFSPTEITVYDENETALKKITGTWSKDGDIYSQTDTHIEGAFNVAEAGCKRYTVELKAMKTDGYEGFLIPFNYEDSDNYLFWNIAGWGNTQSAVQKVSGGVKSNISPSYAQSVNQNQWYDIKIDVDQDYAYCYLDGELIHAQFIKETKGPVYSSVSFDEESGDMIIKMVNTDSVSSAVDINIEGADYIAPEAEEYVLSGNYREDRNSHNNPENIAEVRGVFDGAAEIFTYEIPSYSFVILRLHTKENYAAHVEAIYSKPGSLPEKINVTMADGTTEERAVTWRIPQGAFVNCGSYIVEGKVDGTNLIAYANVDVCGEWGAEFRGENKALFKASSAATAIIAVYNEEGILIESKRTAVTGNTEIEFTAPEKGLVKLMLWDEEMKPLCEEQTQEY